jgi:hypothetical protein
MLLVIPVITLVLLSYLRVPYPILSLNSEREVEAGAEASLTFTLLF